MMLVSFDPPASKLLDHAVTCIYAVTRDKDGTVIAGSLDDAVESRDVWTFSRDVTAAGPDWILDETDEG